MGPGKKEVIESLKYRYAEDLSFIGHFQAWLRGQVSLQHYADNSLRECFKTYRVAKVIRAGKREDLLDLTRDWLSSGRGTDVDGLANEFKKAECTNGLPLALASVLLFLHNPTQVLPLDSYSRMAVGSVEADYQEYIKRATLFREKHALEIQSELQQVSGFLAEIEQKMGFNWSNAEAVREQCYLHRWLKYLGKEYGVNGIAAASTAGIRHGVKGGGGRGIRSGGV